MTRALEARALEIRVLGSRALFRARVGIMSGTNELPRIAGRRTDRRVVDNDARR